MKYTLKQRKEIRAAIVWYGMYCDKSRLEEQHGKDANHGVTAKDARQYCEEHLEAAGLGGLLS